MSVTKKVVKNGQEVEELFFPEGSPKMILSMA